MQVSYISSRPVHPVRRGLPAYERDAVERADGDPDDGKRSHPLQALQDLHQLIRHLVERRYFIFCCPPVFIRHVRPIWSLHPSNQPRIVATRSF